MFKKSCWLKVTRWSTCTWNVLGTVCVILPIYIPLVVVPDLGALRVRSNYVDFHIRGCGVQPRGDWPDGACFTTLLVQKIPVPFNKTTKNKGFTWVGEHLTSDKKIGLKPSGDMLTSSPVVWLSLYACTQPYYPKTCQPWPACSSCFRLFSIETK